MSFRKHGGYEPHDFQVGREPVFIDQLPEKANQLGISERTIARTTPIKVIRQIYFRDKGQF
jgi:hypothetical protein